MSQREYNARLFSRGSHRGAGSERRSAGQSHLVTRVVKHAVSYRHDRRLPRDARGSKCER